MNATTISTITMIARDILGIAVGLGGIVYMVTQYPPGDLNEGAMLILAGISGVPGIGQVISLIRSGLPTESVSLSSQGAEPLPDSSSSSPN